MKTYSIYEAKAKLSELLRQVKSGKSVVVSERGKPIAQLIPFKQPEELLDRLQHLNQSGLLRKKVHDTFPDKATPTEGALERFLEDR